MQSYAYSIFSIVALAIHLMINFELIAGRGKENVLGSRYRGFLAGVLVYYVADAAWGIFAGLGWTKVLYAHTILFFLSLVVFALMWCRFVASYLGFGRRAARTVVGAGWALLALNAACLAANFFTGCVYHFDEKGTYLLGPLRDPLFDLLIAYNAAIALSVLAKAVRCRDSSRGRPMMIFVTSATMTAALVLQVVLPLTPFTSLGCLVGTCFLHVFVVKDEQTARHMAELEDALERTREAEKARSLFFSIVSHDIRTPLNAILGYSELLRDGTLDRAGTEKALDSIRASGTTLLQLVNDVLDLAKTDAGKLALRPETVDLPKLAGDVLSSFGMDAGKKGISLVNAARGVPAAVLDGHRLRQILFNFVGNAVKFTEKGSVTVSSAVRGGDLVLSVADTGCGIRPGMIGRVFDPFFQIRDPSHSAYQDVGSGLGLPICKKLAEAMGGEISVGSEPGKGSTFTLRVPYVAPPPSGAADAAAPGAAPGAAPAAKPPKRVLVVDDSPVNRSVLAAFLKKAGVAEVDFAPDGAEALAALDSAAKAGAPHDFVFSDWWMPGMNGADLVEKLRADPRFAGLPVFAVTADTESDRDARTNLFDGILLKPLTYAKLLDAFAASPRISAS